MLSNKISSVLTLTVAVSGMSLPRADTCYLDTFEEFTNANSLQPNLSPVGSYHGVQYQGWNANVAGVTGTTAGLVPHSGTHDAGVGIVGNVVKMGSISLVAFGSIQAKDTKYFDARSFWFGCGTTSTTSQSPLNSACVLSVVGYDKSGKQVPVSTFSFSPTNALSAPMVKAVLPSYFNDLVNMTIGVASSAATPPTAVIYIDDVEHCNHN